MGAQPWVESLLHLSVWKGWGSAWGRVIALPEYGVCNVVIGPWQWPHILLEQGLAVRSQPGRQTGLPSCAGQTWSSDLTESPRNHILAVEKLLGSFLNVAILPKERKETRTYMNIDHSHCRIQPRPWCLFQEAHPGCQPFSTIPYWNPWHCLSWSPRRDGWREYHPASQ